MESIGANSFRLQPITVSDRQVLGKDGILLPTIPVMPDQRRSVSPLPNKNPSDMTYRLCREVEYIGANPVARWFQ